MALTWSVPCPWCPFSYQPTVSLRTPTSSLQPAFNHVRLFKSLPSSSCLVFIFSMGYVGGIFQAHSCQKSPGDKLTHLNPGQLTCLQLSILKMNIRFQHNFISCTFFPSSTSLVLFVCCARAGNHKAPAQIITLSTLTDWQPGSEGRGVCGKITFLKLLESYTEKCLGRRKSQLIFFFIMFLILWKTWNAEVDLKCWRYHSFTFGWPLVNGC